MKTDTIDIAIENHVERSLVLVKPDGVRRGLSGEVFRRLEQKALKLIALKMVRADEEQAREHYLFEDIGKRHGEAIWQQLLEYLQLGPVIAAVFEGVGAVSSVREILGGTEPSSAKPGTIRGDFCSQTYAFANSAGMAVYNLVHASASREEAVREIDVWFSKDELFSYRRSDQAETHYK